MSTTLSNLHYVWYGIGFLAVPRLTVVCIFFAHQPGAGIVSNLLVGITIFWRYPALQLGFGERLVFSLLLGAFPRLLIGLIGYRMLPADHGLMIAVCVLGVCLDVTAKVVASKLKQSNERSDNSSAQR